MLETLSKLLDLLSPQERRRSYLLLGMILVMALLDLLGVASIMPFMAVLANPDVVESNTYLAIIYQSVGFADVNSFLFFLGVIFFVALVCATTFKACTTYALLRFTQMRNYSLSRRLVAGYLRQPYEWFLCRHSADLGKTVLSEVEQIINGAIIPTMQIIAHGAVVLSLMMLLIVVDPLIATVVTVGLGSTYIGIYLLLRGYLERIGADRVRANYERFKVVQEAFGGIKDVKITGLESTLLQRFDGPANRYARRQAAAQVTAQLPRFVLEAIIFGGMMLLVFYLMAGEGGFQQVLPLVTLYALAGYRLMPALQNIYAHLATLRYAGPALDALHDDLTQLVPHDGSSVIPPRAIPMGLTHGLKLEKITYTYPKAQRPAVNDLTLKVSARTTVGLVGATGSGKTTSVDLILGLLYPQSGKLLVDGSPITSDNVCAWQRTLGYVPQHIFLTDDTVAANIAFGVSSQQIDRQAVERAARIANLHDFVTSEMIYGYDTMVGERGVRLSGGQRQRIGIARALYYDPEVLVFDEATSALDNLTEQAVMDAVHNLGHRKTIILIAHRLTTVRECDEIFLLEKGKLVGQGNYNELLEENLQFRKMAGSTTHVQ